MIQEGAILDVIPNLKSDFERGFNIAQKIIGSMKGYKWHQLQKCLEKERRYILLVLWETLEDHTEGFRK